MHVMINDFYQTHWNQYNQCVISRNGVGWRFGCDADMNIKCERPYRWCVYESFYVLIKSLFNWEINTDFENDSGLPIPIIICLCCALVRSDLVGILPHADTPLGIWRTWHSNGPLSKSIGSCEGRWLFLCRKMVLELDCAWFRIVLTTFWHSNHDF